MSQAAIERLISGLLTSGVRPKDHLVQQAFKLGELAIPALTKLATEKSLLQERAPACYGPIHALRLLSELDARAAIVPILQTLPIENRSNEETGFVDEPAEVWTRDVPALIGRIMGADEVLRELIDDANQSIEIQIVAPQLLVHAAYAKDSLDETVALLREKLADTSRTPYQVTGAILGLCAAGDKASYSAVMAAYREKRAASEYVPASTARQWLLGGGFGSLKCTDHIWEDFYNEHGPNGIVEHDERWTPSRGLLDELGLGSN